ncbi:MAG: hypothetical protein AAF431_15115 [Pseudomonadota bacterium]
MGFLSNTKTVYSLMMAALLAGISTQAMSQTKVVVVPLMSDPVPLANVVTVAKKNGDFTDPISAIESITDALASNPYLIVIGPGIYDIGSQRMSMKDHVHLAGSGRQVTVIKGAVNNPDDNGEGAMVTAANNSSIRDLTLENFSAGGFSTIIRSSISTVLEILNVDLNSTGLGDQTAIRNLSGPFSTPVKLSNVNISVTTKATGSPVNGYGVRNNISSDAELDNVSIVIDGGSNNSYGVLNDNGTANISNSDIKIVNSTGSRIGVANSGNSFSTISNSNIEADGPVAALAAGAMNFSSFGRLRIFNSTLTGAVNAVRADSGSGVNESIILNSILDGSVTGDPVCSSTFSPTGAAVTC